MKIFFTADTHFDHANIIKYCNRPFYYKGDFIGEGELDKRPWKNPVIKLRRVNKMNRVLIDNWNKVVSPEDTVYHLGDFGYINESTYNQYMKELNGNIVIFKGNHDAKNKVKTYLIDGIMHFGGKDVYASHHPPKEDMIPQCDFCICGHVHDEWKLKIYESKPNIPIINVGVDVWDYEPISVNTLLKYYNKIKLIQNHPNLHENPELIK